MYLPLNNSWNFNFGLDYFLSIVAQWITVKQMQPMWLCFLSCRRSEDTFKNAQWRKVKQMQLMRLFFLYYRRFEDTFKNAQWRKVKQMQLMRLCFLYYRRFEATFKNAQWKTVKQMQPMRNVVIGWRLFHWFQSWLSDWVTQVKPKNATNVTMHLLRQAISVDFWKHTVEKM